MNLQDFHLDIKGNLLRRKVQVASIEHLKETKKEKEIFRNSIIKYVTYINILF